VQRPQRIRRPARLHSPDLSHEPLNPGWVVGSKKVSPQSQASLGSPTGSHASATNKREQKQRDKDYRPVKEAESAAEEDDPVEERA
jgi:hypothetical protein